MIFYPIVRMIALQIAAGSVLVAIAIVRLRPLFRAQEGSVGFRLPKFSQPKRSTASSFVPRRPVQDDALMWKEMYTSRSAGLTRIVVMVIGVLVAVLVVVNLVPLAEEAFEEIRETGYFQRGYKRANFSGALRTFSTLLASLAAIAAATNAASSMTSEREDDTWISLLATPQTGDEIVMAKFLGVLWKTRNWLIGLILLWLIGVVCGSVHFLAIPLEMLQVGIFVSFAAALGISFSLRAKSTWKAQASTIATLLFLNGGYLLCLCPLAGILGGPLGRGFEEMLFLVFSGVAPFIEGVSLIAPWEIENHGFSSGIVGVVLACMVGMAGYATGTVVLVSSTIARFDLAAERPVRNEGLWEAPSQKIARSPGRFERSQPKRYRERSETRASGEIGS